MKKTSFILILTAFFSLYSFNLTCNPFFSTKPQKPILNRVSQTHVLYTLPSCPYCDKVLKFAKKNHIPLILKDITNPELKKELLLIGGKSQVPCLIVKQKALYESDEIIRYLEKNKAIKG